VRAWFPCAWCPWEGDIDFRYPYAHDQETIVFDCPECGAENWDDIEETP
jgi:hypothetical protein